MSTFVETHFRNLSSDVSIRRVAAVVAYPGDETVWAGGLILTQPRWNWTVVALSHTSKPDCQASFKRALERLGACGEIATVKQTGNSELTVPRLFIYQERLPLLGTGKVDYNQATTIAQNLYVA